MPLALWLLPFSMWTPAQEDGCPREATTALGVCLGTIVPLYSPQASPLTTYTTINASSSIIMFSLLIKMHLYSLQTQPLTICTTINNSSICHVCMLIYHAIFYENPEDQLISFKIFDNFLNNL